MPLIILFVSCNEDPSNALKEEQFKTVYGLVRTFENSQIANQIGDITKNSCTHIEALELSTYPNPTAFGVTIELNSDSKQTITFSIETALGEKQFLDSLSASSYPSPIIVPQHESYFKRELYSAEVNIGRNSIHLDLDQIGTGVYYLIYEDSEGNSDCYPLAIQRYD